MTPRMEVEFEKRFSADTVVQAEFSQPVDAFSVSVLFGPSGCGKTTILRCLAGLERPEQGAIRFARQTWFESSTGKFLRPQQRHVGFLFQEYALFPHLNVVDNIAYPRSREPADRADPTADLLDLFDLHGLGKRFPHQLSGGQKQRVALARVLAWNPRLLLLDEPLSALDSSLREKLRGELRKLLEAYRIPAIMVTHDRTEAIAMADQIIVLSDGRVRQLGRPDEVFTRPSDLNVAEIVGVETVAPATILSQADGLVTIKILGRQLLAVPGQGLGKRVYACIRAEDVILQKGLSGTTSARNRLEAVVESIVAEGPLVRVTLDCGFRLMALVTRPACAELNLVVGDRVLALVKVPAIHLLPRS